MWHLFISRRDECQSRVQQPVPWTRPYLLLWLLLCNCQSLYNRSRDVSSPSLCVSISTVIQLASWLVTSVCDRQGFAIVCIFLLGTQTFLSILCMTTVGWSIRKHFKNLNGSWGDCVLAPILKRVYSTQLHLWGVREVSMWCGRVWLATVMRLHFRCHVLREFK